MGEAGGLRTFATVPGMFGPVPDVPDCIRLPIHFDPARLSDDLARLEGEEWTRHVAAQNYEGAWSMLPLRAPAGETHPVRLVFASSATKKFVDTPLLDRTPYFREVLASFACPLRLVRLMRLAPGSAIREHCDPDLEAQAGLARLHVPIATNERVEFRLKGRPVAMEPGSCWYLRLTEPHQAANRGETDRVHLVIDAAADEWLLDMLARGSVH